MAKLKEGDQVVFNFKDVNRIGVIESVKLIDKVKRYQVRDEAGRLYPYLGVNTKAPGKIDVALTNAYFEAKKEETQEGVLIGSEGSDKESTK
jgi:hypothetical protein